MARYAPTSQRLLSTLMQTSKFYAARPSLTSPILFRFYSEAAEPTQPRPSGFSISFADGSLDDIIRKRKEAVVEKSASEVDVEDVDGVHVDSKPAKAKPARVNSKRKSAKPAQANGTAAKITAPKEISKRKTGRLAQAKGAPIKVSPANDNSELKLSTRAAPTTGTATEEPQSVVEGEPEASQPALPPQTKKAPRSEPIVSSPSPRPQPKKEHWQIQKAALKEKFGNEGWNPRKKLSPDTIEGIRALHAQYPDRYTTPVLAEQFQVSKEAVRRILKSKWSSNLDPEKQAERRERWASRHDRIWDQKAAIGLRPERTVSREPENPDAFEEELRAKEMLAAHR